MIHLWLARDAHLVHYPVKGGKLNNLVVITADAWSGRTWSEAASRIELLQRWAATGQFGSAPMIARDGLHMTDASYGCLAADLAQALAADLRPGTLAGAGPRGVFTIW